MTLNLTVKLLSVIQERRGRSRDYGCRFKLNGEPARNMY
jgi:hypothetical protein